jgi:hypothetical protein
MNVRATWFAGGLAAAYLLIGSYLGYSITMAMPAVNWKGGAFVAATWPAWLTGWPFGRPSPPSWCFTFDGEAQ